MKLHWTSITAAVALVMAAHPVEGRHWFARNEAVQVNNEPIEPLPLVDCPAHLEGSSFCSNDHPQHQQKDHATATASSFSPSLVHTSHATTSHATATYATMSAVPHAADEPHFRYSFVDGVHSKLSQIAEAVLPYSDSDDEIEIEEAISEGHLEEASQKDDDREDVLRQEEVHTQHSGNDPSGASNKRADMEVLFDNDDDVEEIEQEPISRTMPVLERLKRAFVGPLEPWDFDYDVEAPVEPDKYYSEDEIQEQVEEFAQRIVAQRMQEKREEEMKEENGGPVVHAHKRQEHEVPPPAHDGILDRILSHLPGKNERTAEFVATPSASSTHRERTAKSVSDTQKPLSDQHERTAEFAAGPQSSSSHSHERTAKSVTRNTTVISTSPKAATTVANPPLQDAVDHGDHIGQAEKRADTKRATWFWGKRSTSEGDEDSPISTQGVAQHDKQDKTTNPQEAPSSDPLVNNNGPLPKSWFFGRRPSLPDFSKHPASSEQQVTDPQSATELHEETDEKARLAKREAEKHATAHKRDLEQKAAEAKKLAEQKAQEARKVAEQKAAEAKKLAEQKAAEAKQELERQAKETKRLAEEKAAKAKADALEKLQHDKEEETHKRAEMHRRDVKQAELQKQQEAKAAARKLAEKKQHEAEKAAKQAQAKAIKARLAAEAKAEKARLAAEKKRLAKEEADRHYREKQHAKEEAKRVAAEKAAQAKLDAQHKQLEQERLALEKKEHEKQQAALKAAEAKAAKIHSAALKKRELEDAAIEKAALAKKAALQAKLDAEAKAHQKRLDAENKKHEAAMKAAQKKIEAEEKAAAAKKLAAEKSAADLVKKQIAEEQYRAATQAKKEAAEAKKRLQDLAKREAELAKEEKLVREAHLKAEQAEQADNGDKPSK